MEANIQEALRAKDNAEKLFAMKDFVSAKNYALEAQMLCPELESISQMVATFEIYDAAQRKIGGEIDFYLILGLEPYSDKWKLKKQYKKMAVLLHPDMNKTVGAEGAFKLVSEAFTLLSDSAKRKSYDLRRKKQLSRGVLQTNLSSVHAGGGTDFENCSKSSSSHNRLDTFWTVCTSCHVQYEYLRKYVNKRLSCKNCRGVFVAVETGIAPVTGSFPYSPWPCAPDNGYGSHRHNGSTYVPASSVCFTGNGVPGHHSVHNTAHHSAHSSDCVSNSSFQWSAYPVLSTEVVDHNGLGAKSFNIVHHANGSISKGKVHGKHHLGNTVVDTSFSVQNGYREPTVTKLGRPAKKMKVDMCTTTGNGNEEMVSKANLELNFGNGNEINKNNSKISTTGDIAIKRYSAAPVFDARKLLIDKARTVIRKKLEEMKLASTATALAEKNERALAEVSIIRERPLDHQLKLKKAVSVPITVPDSDFHDFDEDRSEECFKPKQIWALYDEEDGMPRLYCLIRQVISLKPFKVHISYLGSKTDAEFGSVNWLDSGFTKSCGHFRAFNTDIVDQVNIFSHLLSREKVGRGGCVRIYPKSGDIWAVYRNWSSDWNRTTPDKVRHQYEMVEVLDDYSEDLGVHVVPLIKLDGFKTVYQRNTNRVAIRWISRREMLCFSHQVPSCILQGKARDLPDGCYDLDPAATPDELLQASTEVQAENPHKMEKCVASPIEPINPVTEIQVEEKQPFHSMTPVFRDLNEVPLKKTPIEVLQDLDELQDCAEDRVEKTTLEVLQDYNDVQVEKTPSEVLKDLNEVEVEKTHDEVLQDFNEVQVENTPSEVLNDFNEMQVEKTPAEVLQDFNEVLVEKTPSEVIQDCNEVRTENSSIDVFQRFDAFQVEKTPFEVLQDFDDVWLHRTPFEVLQDFNEMLVEKIHYTDTDATTPLERFQPEMEVRVEEKRHFWGESSAATPAEVPRDMSKAHKGKVFESESCDELLQSFRL